jgi:hypothetical protein
MTTSSRTHIRVGNREFISVDELLESGKNIGFKKEMVGDYSPWWESSKVMFPEKDGACSAAFVEVYQEEVTVGYNDNYLTYSLGTNLLALRFAEAVNQSWWDFMGTATGFLARLKSDYASFDWEDEDDAFDWEDEEDV